MKNFLRTPFCVKDFKPEIFRFTSFPHLSESLQPRSHVEQLFQSLSVSTGQPVRASNPCNRGNSGNFCRKRQRRSPQHNAPQTRFTARQLLLSETLVQSNSVSLYSTVVFAITNGLSHILATIVQSIMLFKYSVHIFRQFVRCTKMLYSI